MNIILPILSFLCGVMLTETASGSSEEGKPSPGVVQELWFGIPGASVKDLTHRKIFETAAPDVRTISHLDVENLGDRYGARYSALLKVPASGEVPPLPVFRRFRRVMAGQGCLPEGHGLHRHRQRIFRHP